MLQLDGTSEQVKGEKKNATRVEAKIVFFNVHLYRSESRVEARKVFEGRQRKPGLKLEFDRGVMFTGLRIGL